MKARVLVFDTGGRVGLKAGRVSGRPMLVGSPATTTVRIGRTSSSPGMSASEDMLTPKLDWGTSVTVPGGTRAGECWGYCTSGMPGMVGFWLEPGVSCSWYVPGWSNRTSTSTRLPEESMTTGVASGAGRVRPSQASTFMLAGVPAPSSRVRDMNFPSAALTRRQRWTSPGLMVTIGPSTPFTV